MRSLVVTSLGLCLLGLLAYDVCATILRARKRPGPIAGLVHRALWSAATAVAWRVSRTRRHRILSSLGPVLLPSLFGVYVLMLAAGYGLVFLPRMRDGFDVAPRAASSPWVESLTFSGATLVTIGSTDVTPTTDAMRFVAILEGLSGVALISLAVTYLLTVYGALERRRAVALSLYHQAGRGADVADFVVHYYRRGRFRDLDAPLRAAARDVQELLESHIEHPVIHYFHPDEVYKSMARSLFVLLETAAVLRCCIDKDAYAETLEHPEVEALETNARYVLDELVDALGLREAAEERLERPDEERSRRAACFRRATRKLADAGIRTPPDPALAFDAYAANRGEWEAKLHRFSRFLGYDWDEVSGDGSLEYAADETIERPELAARA